MILEKYSIGIGDRFGQQGKAQLAAVQKARRQGLAITPVWNKSYREHNIVGTKPADVRMEADEAVRALGWERPYYVDADHVGLNNVELFIDSCDFFTLDVADYIGGTADESNIQGFVDRHSKYVGRLAVAGTGEAFEVSREQIEETARRFLPAIKQAGRIYRHIEAAKGAGEFITEVSMDETDQPQTPIELLFILAAVAEEKIGAATIAPKFSGRFNKGVDYAGNVGRFAKEFAEDVAVVAFAVREFGLPESLKLSVHSGSDKFSIYGPMNEVIRKFDAGLHIKTAGTTWLEELVGLAMAGGEALGIVKEIYGCALLRQEELCGPYASVIDIDKGNLPQPEDVVKWDAERFASAIRHEQSCSGYNPDMRQLLHVAYKVAAEMGERFREAAREHEKIIARGVTDNLYERHIKPIFYWKKKSV